MLYVCGGSVAADVLDNACTIIFFLVLCVLCSVFFFKFIVVLLCPA